MFILIKFQIFFIIALVSVILSLPESMKAAEQQPALPVMVPPLEQTTEKLKISGDFYAAGTNLMPYSGYQNDIITTVYALHQDYRIIPFVRYVITNYYYLIDLPVNNTISTSDRRTAVGLGLDYKYNNYLKFRFIFEAMENKLSNTSYNQESYGIIYNQYLEFRFFEINNYLESFLIPRVSSKTIDTFFKVQALKTYYINRSAMSSNAIYPFVQTKVKVNDDNNFGVSGQNFSFGPGYKYYGVNSLKDSFAFVLEAHSILYQSKDFNGDWMQLLAVLQLWID